MSKIGRKPIKIAAGLQVEIKGQEVHYKGAHSSGTHLIPDMLVARVEEGSLLIVPSAKEKVLSRVVKRVWGLHRAILANKLDGAAQEFECKIEINGLGYKAVKSGGDKLVFTLGHSHKIDFTMQPGVTVDIDKSGQKLTFKSANKELAGLMGSQVRTLRPPEPYKGTGVKLASEVIARKAGKTKGA